MAATTAEDVAGNDPLHAEWSRDRAAEQMVFQQTVQQATDGNEVYDAEGYDGDTHVIA